MDHSTHSRVTHIHLYFSLSFWIWDSFLPHPSASFLDILASQHNKHYLEKNSRKIQTQHLISFLYLESDVFMQELVTRLEVSFIFFSILLSFDFQRDSTKVRFHLFLKMFTILFLQFRNQWWRTCYQLCWNGTVVYHTRHCLFSCPSTRISSCILARKIRQTSAYKVSSFSTSFPIDSWFMNPFSSTLFIFEKWLLVLLTVNWLVCDFFLVLFRTTEAGVPAFKKHIDRLIKHWKRVYLLNLLSKKKKEEELLTAEYERQLVLNFLFHFISNLCFLQ